MKTGSIADMKELHAGKRLFVISSGPSLNDLDLTPLKSRIVMGLNRSFMIWPNSYYHCVFDHRLFDEYEDELKKTRFLITLDDRPWGIPLNLLGSEGFSWDLEEGVYSGYTISYFALQVAIYLGFKEIFYLGLDLGHRERETHFFGKDYRSENHEQTEFPKMRRSFENIAPTLEEKGIEVRNCSPVSTLECFKYLSFEDAIAR